MTVRFSIAFAVGLVPIAACLPIAAPVFAQTSSSFEFTLDPAQRQANWDAATAEVVKADRNIAGLAQDVRNLLRTQDVVEPYMAGYSMSSANLGDVLALAYFNAVMLANGGKTDDPTQAQIDGIRNQIASASEAQFARLTDAQKQETADRLLYLIILQNALAEGLKGQPALDQWMDAFAKTNSEMLGFDVRQVQMGPSGFVTAAGSSANPVQTSQPIKASTAAPSLGTGRDRILGVGYQSTAVFIPGPYGGSLQQVNKLTVLLKDGRACEDCLEAILKNDAAAMAALEPRDKGRWSKSGQTYRVTFDDGDTDDIAADKLYGPAPKGAALSGRFKAVSGTSVGIATTLSVDFLDLAPNGSFSLEGNTSSLGTYAIANVDRGAQTGRYTVDGYRIIFDYANGTREEESFVFYDKDFLIIGEKAHYIPDD